MTKSEEKFSSAAFKGVRKRSHIQLGTFSTGTKTRLQLAKAQEELTLERAAFEAWKQTYSVELEEMKKPVPMLLHCPICTARHIDAGLFAIQSHHTHACQSCGHVWRPAVIPTVGVRFLPGFKDHGAAANG